MGEHDALLTSNRLAKRGRVFIEALVKRAVCQETVPMDSEVGCYLTISAFSIILTPSRDTPFPFTVIVLAAYSTSSLFIGL